MNLRNSKKDDFKVVETIYKSMVGEPFCTWNERYPTIEDIEFDHTHENLYILEDNGEIIGAVSVEKPNHAVNQNCTCEVSRVVISKKHQGKGLAKQMVKMLAKILYKKGLTDIEVIVSKVNIPAFKTYEKLGFKVTSEHNEYGIESYICKAKIKDLI